MADNPKLLATLHDLSGADLITLIGFKSMPINTNDLDQWFVALEREFVERKIETDLLQYFLTLAQLDHETKSSIQNILSYVPAADKYQTLKKAIIISHPRASVMQLQNVVNNVDLKNTKPSILLQKILQLGEKIPKKDILKVLWLKSLPATLQGKLLSNTEDWSDIDTKADVFNDIDAIAIFNRRILHITANVEDDGCNSEPNSSDSWDYPETYPYMCYYHAHFGNAARKCNPPCSESPWLL